MIWKHQNGVPGVHHSNSIFLRFEWREHISKIMPNNHFFRGSHMFWVLVIKLSYMIQFLPIQILFKCLNWKHQKVSVEPLVKAYYVSYVNDKATKCIPEFESQYYTRTISLLHEHIFIHLGSSYSWPVKFRIIDWWLGLIKFCINAWVLSNVIYLLSLERQKTRNPTDHPIPMTETYDKLNPHAEKSLLSGVDEVKWPFARFQIETKAVFYLSVLARFEKLSFIALYGDLCKLCNHACMFDPRKKK